MAQEQRSQLFVGFSSENKRPSDTTIFDIELIQQDLRNHFNTRKGERVMLPEFGSIIWDLLFEPFTEGLIEDIKDDVTDIINFDSRVQLQDITVNDFEYGLIVEVLLLYTPYNATGTLSLTFDRRLAERGIE